MLFYQIVIDLALKLNKNFRVCSDQFLLKESAEELLVGEKTWVISLKRVTLLVKEKFKNQSFDWFFFAWIFVVYLATNQAQIQAQGSTPEAIATFSKRSLKPILWLVFFRLKFMVPLATNQAQIQAQDSTPEAIATFSKKSLKPILWLIGDTSEVV